MDLDIRSGEPPDISGIRSVATDAWHAAHAPIIGSDTVEAFLDEYYDPESFQDRLDHDDTILDVATDTDETIVGYVFASRDDETTFNLVQIYVDPSQWGNGVGRQLLEHVEQKIRDRGGERITLGVMAENDRAVGFYEAAGYERTDEFYDDNIETRSYTYTKELG